MRQVIDSDAVPLTNEQRSAILVQLCKMAIVQPGSSLFSIIVSHSSVTSIDLLKSNVFKRFILKRFRLIQLESLEIHEIRSFCRRITGKTLWCESPMSQCRRSMTRRHRLMGKKFTTAQIKGDGDDPKQSRTVTAGGNSNAEFSWGLLIFVDLEGIAGIVSCEIFASRVFFKALHYVAFSVLHDRSKMTSRSRWCFGCNTRGRRPRAFETPSQH